MSTNKIFYPTTELNVILRYTLLLNFSYVTQTLPDTEPFPQGIGQGIILDNLGNFSIINEPTPVSYFYIQDEKFLFKNTQSINLGIVEQHGQMISPGRLDGTDAIISVFFSKPTAKWNLNFDSFVFRIGIGFRTTDLVSWVGVLLEANWNGINWLPELKLSIVSVVGLNFTYLEIIEDTLQNYKDINELKFVIQGNKIAASFNKYLKINKTGNFVGDDQVILLNSLYSLEGLTQISYPCIYKIDGQSLTSGRKYHIEELAQFKLPLYTSGVHFYQLPIYKLEKDGIIIQIAPQRWKFLKDVVIIQADIPPFGANKDEIIVAERDTLFDSANKLCKVVYT